VSRRHPSPRSRAPGPRLLAVTLLAGALALASASCGEDELDVAPQTQKVDSVAPGRVLAGVVREPAPVVDGTDMPSLSSAGDVVEFRAEPGGLMVVYFGYTNCPDVCPTTMFDHTVALRRLPADKADRVQTVMVTIDPDRDQEILTDYVRSFVPDAEAAGSSDPAVLEAVAEPFGVSYAVTTSPNGSIEVSHSGFLYVVNDRGELVLAWPFGTSSEEMAADMFQLLERGGSSS
jgi:protein SCO1